MIFSSQMKTENVATWPAWANSASKQESRALCIFIFNAGMGRAHKVRGTHNLEPVPHPPHLTYLGQQFLPSQSPLRLVRFPIPHYVVGWGTELSSQLENLTTLRPSSPHLSFPPSKLHSIARRLMQAVGYVEAVITGAQSCRSGLSSSWDWRVARRLPTLFCDPLLIALFFPLLHRVLCNLNNKWENWKKWHSKICSYPAKNKR